MTDHGSIHDARPFRDAIVGLLKALGLLAAAALAIHVSWNMFAPDLFGLPAAGMKHALGLALAGFLAGVLLRRRRFVQHD